MHPVLVLCIHTLEYADHFHEDNIGENKHPYKTE